MTRAFFDTNIVLYVIDRRDEYASWRDIARKLLASYASAGSVVVSTQVLQEAYDNGIKKLKLPATVVSAYVADLATFEVVGSDRLLVMDAIALAQRFQFRIYDALLLAAAGRAGCDTLYTQDLSHGQVIHGVKIVNPFKEVTAP